MKKDEIEPEIEILLKKLLGKDEYEILKAIILSRGVFEKDKVE